jgi:hypothetical protein
MKAMPDTGNGTAQKGTYLVMDSKPTKPKPGDSVVLIEAPPGLLQGLPIEDQKAISEAVGKPIRLIGYDDDGRAELEFTDAEGVIHFIYVSASVIRAQ